MAKAKKRVLRKQQISAPKTCYFCVEKKDPDFSDTAVLSRFLTERAKIIPRSRSGLCSKHQKALTLNVKYARHLGLLPFTARI